MNYSVLALDQAMVSTGWAHYRAGDDKPTWGLREDTPWGNQEGQHLWAFFEWLGHLCTDLQVTHLFVEDVRFSHKHEETLTQLVASIGQIGQAAIVAHLLTKRGQPVEFAAVSPLDWRPLFIGKHKKPGGMVDYQWRKLLKEMAVNACLKRGWLVDNDDMADALGILTFGVCSVDDTFLLKQNPIFGRTAAENEAKLREL